MAEQSTDQTSEQAKLVEYLKRVTTDLRRARKRVAELEAGQTADPVAVVGMSAHYPGAADADELWRLTVDGRDTIGPFPDDRGWDLDALYDPDPAAPGKFYIREAGFLETAGEFDAAFFGISPREALAMDPQQRVLLEAAWEAIEHAGIPAPTLRGSRTGVYAGLVEQSYLDLDSPPEFEGYQMTSKLSSMASGRISYTLGLEGPSVSIDTACSSGLVALHLAARALHAGECDLALAGAVYIAGHPGGYLDGARQRGLAADGRCKPFSAAADGIGWSEGGGVLVLERLSDARRNGRHVLAIVRGSAVNSDGASNGLTAPNGPSQERVIRTALADAGLRPSDVDAVEAHGTGTRLGDPIEAQALLTTYGQGRPAGRPLLLGSCKSNIGHAQAAAGIAGLVKMIQAIRHAHLPRTLHLTEPSPFVDWSSGDVELLVEGRDWPETDAPRRGAVSAFGASGTNAHVILEQAPPEDGAKPGARPAPAALPWVVSGHTPAALRAQAVRLASALPADADPYDVAHSLATTRTALDHRAVVVGADRATLLAGLAAVAEGADSALVVRGSATEAGKTVFVFPGQGSQWAEMAVPLLDSAAEFAEQIAACAKALEPFVDFSLEDVLRGREGAPGLDRIDVVQPVLFAVMVSLAALWQAWGVRPDAVIGHSQGEVAAAYVAGGLSMEDAARIVALRSRIARKLHGVGGMGAVALPRAEVAARLDAWSGKLSVTVENGPNAVLVGGDRDSLAEFLAECKAGGARVKRFDGDYASHSPQVELVRDELLAAFAPVRPRAGTVPFFSTVTAGWMDTATLDAGYWYRNLRDTVEFARSVGALAEAGFGVFVEVSPHPVLLASTQETVGDDAVLTGTLRRDDGDLATFLRALASLHTRGVEADWARAFPCGQNVELPTYAFQRERFWHPAGAGSLDAGALGLTAAGHPLLGVAIPVAGTDEVLFTNRVSVRMVPWVGAEADGSVVLPSAALLEMVLRAGDEVGCSAVAELRVVSLIALPACGGVHLQVRVEAPDRDGLRAVTVQSRPEDGDQLWATSATGVLAPRGSRPDAGDGTAAGEGTRVAVELAKSDRPDGYTLHPALLDAVVRSATGPDGQVVAWRDTRVHVVGAVAVHAVLTEHCGGWRVRAVDRAGQPVVSAEVTVGPAGPTPGREHEALLRTTWTPIELPAAVGRTGQEAVVVPLAAEPGEDVPAAVHRLTGTVLTLVRRWLADDSRTDELLVFRTSGAVSVANEPVTDPAAAAVWGQVRSAQSENPGRFVLLDAETDEPVAAVVATGEPQIAVRAGRAAVPRLQRVPPGQANRFDPGGTVLVTGGTGTLGALFARHLVVRHGVRHLLLTSRRGPSAPGADALHAELAALGAEVTIAACDVGDRDALGELVARVPADRPLRAVLHAAGVIDDGLIAGVDHNRLADVLRPKADAAWHLHELTRDHDLTAFVLFSSLAGVIGGAGQSSYAAANTFLDGLAEHRASLRLPATSVGWGVWAASAGSGELGAVDLDRIARAGYPPIPSDAGPTMMDLAIGSGLPVLTAAPLDTAALRTQPRQVPPVLTALVRVPSRPNARNSAVPAASLAGDLAGLDEPGQRDRILASLRAEVGGVLGHADPDVIGVDEHFADLGFDSLTGVELRNRLGELTGLRLPTTLVFDHPTLTALTTYLRTALTSAPVSTTGPNDGLAAALAADISLDPDIRPAADIVPVAADPRSVLLTGATGFLGAYLLRDLLANTGAHVHCLVRAADEPTARTRLRAAVEWYGLGGQVDESRVTVHPGDLAAPSLGLPPTRFDDLSRTVDAVYHPAAEVNWVRPYPSVRSVNVLAVKELLRLAARHRTVPLHHVSTLGVFLTGASGGIAVTDRTGPGTSLPTGYTQSKWAAEQVIDLARERGLPVSIYRIDLIAGDHRTGACQTRDFVWLSLKGMLQAGAAPADLAVDFRMMPVDYASAAITHLSRTTHTRTFHVCGHTTFPLSAMLSELRGRGHRLDPLAAESFRARILSDQSNALVPLMDAFDVMAAAPATFYPPIDDKETTAALAGSGIECPPADLDHFARHVDFFTIRGYFPDPTAQDSN